MGREADHLQRRKQLLDAVRQGDRGRGERQKGSAGNKESEPQ